jgi:Methylamine utilisation protein MauE
MTASDILFSLGVMGRVCLGLVFLTAAIEKLRSSAVLEGVVANYRILPRALVAPVSAALPWVELVLGATLLTLVPSVWPPAAGIALLCIFAWAMSVNLWRGRSDIDCGCHQAAMRQTLRWSLVARNLGLVLLLVPALPEASTSSWPLLAVGGMAGATAYLLYLLFNTLASLPTFNRTVA